ncbi:MAG: hypothetical protein QW797_05465 [Thermoproteota archaeon]
MDRDRIAGVALGLVIILAMFLLPFGSFLLPSGQLGEATLFSMVAQFVGNIVNGVQQPMNLLIYEIIILASFIILIAAGALGFYPLRSGIIGILAMILITTVTIFNPVLGLNTPSYGAGYFIIWGASAAATVIGRLRPNARRKIASAVSQPPPQEVVETSSPPMDLFKPLSSEEEAQTPSAETSPASQPTESFSSVGLNVIEEEMTRIRAFLVVLEDENKDNIISGEAYGRLSMKLRKMLDELEAERKTILDMLIKKDRSQRS